MKRLLASISVLLIDVTSLTRDIGKLGQLNSGHSFQFLALTS